MIKKIYGFRYQISSLRRYYRALLSSLFRMSALKVTNSIVSTARSQLLKELIFINNYGK